MSRAATSLTLSAADRAAGVLLELLDPVCERVEIAGSVRRRKAEINDIEVVAIAKVGTMQRVGLFGPESEEANLLSELCARAEVGNIEALRRPQPAKNPVGEKAHRKFPWGEKYKRLIVLDRGLWHCVDLFITTPAQWGPLFAIRTGPSDFSRLLVTSRDQGGAMPPMHRQCDGFLQRLRGADDWENLETPEEADYFAALGVPCWEPQIRSERLLREHLGQRSPRRETPYAPYASAAGARWS